MLITDGVSQEQRLSPAIVEGYVEIDERSFEDMLVVGKDIAANLVFRDQENRPNGTWEFLFDSRVVVLAMILNVDLDRLDLEFQALYSTPKEVQIRYVSSLYIQTDHWMRQLALAQQPATWELYLKMVSAVETTLSAQWQNLADLATSQVLTDVLQRFTEFSPVWGAISDSFVSIDENLVHPTGFRFKLSATFRAIRQAIAYWQSVTPAAVEDVLHTQDHEPALGLFMVFLRLFQVAQERLNWFTQRHLDFYYQEFLQADCRPPKPNSAYLVFTGVPNHSDPIFIAQGTAFSPGMDVHQKDLIYEANQDLWISEASVRSLLTLRFGKDALIFPEGLLRYVTHIKSDSIATDPDLQLSELVAKPIFGMQRDIEQDSQMSSVDLGWAIASSSLFLSEGARKIDIQVGLSELKTADLRNRLDPSTLETLNPETFCQLLGELFRECLFTTDPWLTTDFISRLLRRADALFSEDDLLLVQELLQRFPTMDGVSTTEQVSPKQMLFATLRGLFTIEITTPSGWSEVDDYLVLPPTGDETHAPFSLTFQLEMEPDFEPIVPYLREVHQGDWETKLPIIRFLVDQKAPMFAYSLFDGFALDTIEIRTSVKGLKTLRVSNQLGLLDPSGPFNPFGPLPTSNSYMVLGSYEMAKKRITSAKLNLRWTELPRTLGGFAEHYQGYPESYENHSFVVRVTTLRGGDWLPEASEEQSYLSLFQNGVHDEMIDPTITLPLRITGQFKPIAPQLKEDEFNYDLKTRNGFIKLSLENPATAFGHESYPGLLTHVLSTNARKKRNPLPLPNAPYTPKVNNISLDYESQKLIRIGDLDEMSPEIDGVYHIHPFGKARLNTHFKARHDFLPNYPKDGNLFIGIRAQELSGRLSLFFQMKEDAATPSTDSETIVWEYLANNQWQLLRTSNQISDTTQGFLTSGIVVLDIPPDITLGNTIMPSDLYWLRVSTHLPASAFSRLYSVYAHALSVTATPQTATMEWDPAASHSPQWKAVTSIPGVNLLQQKNDFFGGRPQESPIQMKTRISERLGHKFRATTPWDYERLVLENFPEIDKVKCFANLQFGKSGIHPGYILVIVVRRHPNCVHKDCKQAQVGAIELSRIRNFLQMVSTPFVQIDVRNPVFEKIQIRCQVMFKRPQVGSNLINRLNRQFSEYLCPWTTWGYQGDFGWQIRIEDLEAKISALDYVDFVTSFSLLQITQRAEQFRLQDTATPGKQLSTNRQPLKPRFPWGIAVPAKHHLIETIPRVKAYPAQTTGINYLEIGQTFIIQRRTSDVETQ